MIIILTALYVLHLGITEPYRHHTWPPTSLERCAEEMQIKRYDGVRYEDMRCEPAKRREGWR
jgi:hypothetical protein